MTWFEALNILDTGGIGHERDSQCRLEALRIVTGYSPAVKELVTTPSPDADGGKPE
jgi:hypothetical protein